MIEAVGGFLGKTLGTLVGPIWRYLIATFQRPRIRLTKAPKNLLEHLTPAVSQDRVRELLGPAHQVIDQYWFYRFADALVQLEFRKGGGAKSVALGLVGKRKEHRFPVPNFKKSLGQLSIADVKCEGSMLRYRDSLRHREILVEVRLGPTGAWSYWTYGAMMAFGSQALHESLFEWDTKSNCLITDPSLVLVNWIAISDGGDEVYFDWSMA
ncbi:hypothetical protein [Methylomonas sp. LWB]|uniref:hypothetical protein n=1 Tax=Methylomonas sp. LWB TaxID=1905845 RepID=UPI0008D9A1B3|nr:hypothetical protein [Methylomonas sp. LWB]